MLYPLYLMGLVVYSFIITIFKDTLDNSVFIIYLE